MNKITGIFRLTRFEHALMLAFAVFIGMVIAESKMPQVNEILLFALLVPIFSEMGSFALNDILDVETDKKNNMTKRPLISGDLKINEAWAICIISFILSVLFVIPLGIIPTMVLILFNVFAILYNYKLKDLPLIGNIYIGTTMAIPFIFGNVVLNDQINTTNILIAALGFSAGVAREIIKSAQDMHGDKEVRNSKTLPILIGERNSILIASLIYIVTCIIAVLPFHFGLEFNYISGLLVGMCVAIIIYIVYRLLTKGRESYKKARNLSLVAFALGMIGILFAIILK